MTRGCQERPQHQQKRGEHRRGAPNMLELSRDQAIISRAVKTLRRILELNAGREAADGASRGRNPLAQGSMKTVSQRNPELCGVRE